MTYDVYGLGNALVDMAYAVEDEFLQEHDVAKGLMTLVDEDRMAALQSNLDHLTPERMGGGSAANSMFAVRGFGGSAFYSCRVSPDETGRFFVDEIQKVGIGTNPLNEAIKGPSGRCLILVTPDAQRSLNTLLGVSEHLAETEIDPDVLVNSGCLFIEGYLASSPTGSAAAVRAREIAEEAGVKTSLTLSDPSMVSIFRDSLTRMLGNGIDVLFANEQEALAWTKSDRVDIAARELADIAPTVWITLGAHGCLSVSRHGTKSVPGFEVDALDTNGAGDIFAGACLAATARGIAPADAGRFANFVAANLVTQFGARLSSIAAYQRLKSDYS